MDKFRFFFPVLHKLFTWMSWDPLEDIKESTAKHISELERHDKISATVGATFMSKKDMIKNRRKLKQQSNEHNNKQSQEDIN